MTSQHLLIINENNQEQYTHIIENKRDLTCKELECSKDFIRESKLLKEHILTPDISKDISLDMASDIPIKYYGYNKKISTNNSQDFSVVILENSINNSYIFIFDTLFLTSLILWTRYNNSHIAIKTTEYFSNVPNSIHYFLVCDYFCNDFLIDKLVQKFLDLINKIGYKEAKELVKNRQMIQNVQDYDPVLQKRILLLKKLSVKKYERFLIIVIEKCIIKALEIYREDTDGINENRFDSVNFNPNPIRIKYFLPLELIKQDFVYDNKLKYLALENEEYMDLVCQKINLDSNYSFLADFIYEYQNSEGYSKYFMTAFHYVKYSIIDLKLSCTSGYFKLREYDAIILFKSWIDYITTKIERMDNEHAYNINIFNDDYYKFVLRVCRISVQDFEDIIQKINDEYGNSKVNLVSYMFSEYLNQCVYYINNNDNEKETDNIFLKLRNHLENLYNTFSSIPFYFYTKYTWILQLDNKKIVEYFGNKVIYFYMFVGKRLDLFSNMDPKFHEKLFLKLYNLGLDFHILDLKLHSELIIHTIKRNIKSEIYNKWLCNLENNEYRQLFFICDTYDEQNEYDDYEFDKDN